MGETIFKYISDQGLPLRYLNNFNNSTIKKINNTIEREKKDLNKHFPPKDIQMVSKYMKRC